MTEWIVITRGKWKQTMKPTTYQDIKTFEDACAVEGVSVTVMRIKFFFLRLIFWRDSRWMIAEKKLAVIIAAINRLANGGEEWKVDWNDSDQDKYYPWLYMGGSSGFRFLDCAYWRLYSSVGSRLCFISDEAARYTASNFLPLYKDLMT